MINYAYHFQMNNAIIWWCLFPIVLNSIHQNGFINWIMLGLERALEAYSYTKAASSRGLTTKKQYIMSYVSNKFQLDDVVI